MTTDWKYGIRLLWAIFALVAVGWIMQPYTGQIFNAYFGLFIDALQMQQ